MELGAVIPYLKKIQKYINHVTHLFSSTFFNRKSATFAVLRNTDIDCILYIIKVLAILMTSAKMATLGLLKVNVF